MIKKIQGPNISRPDEFKNRLQCLMTNVYELMELAKEYDLQAVAEDGVRLFDADLGKTCFQVADQYDRPAEFLQVLLDMVRANYEPFPLGTFFLNSNMGFLYDGIPGVPFRLGYVSLLSKVGEDFQYFYSNAVLPYFKKCGYVPGEASAVYVVVSTGRGRYGVNLVRDVSSTLGSGFSVDEALELLASTVDSGLHGPCKRVYVGYNRDMAIGRRVRFSSWIFY